MDNKDFEQFRDLVQEEMTGIMNQLIEDRIAGNPPLMGKDTRNVVVLSGVVTMRMLERYHDWLNDNYEIKPLGKSKYSSNNNDLKEMKKELEKNFGDKINE